MRYFFRVEYDGTGYSGWQRQRNASSVQAALESAFTVATRRGGCSVIGAGRTDAGVHALGQGAHIDFDTALDDERGCELSVNALLPPDVALYGLRRVGDDFHARYSAVSRRYRYQMCFRKRPLLHKRVWMLFYQIDWHRVAGELPAICGTHDFSTFCASGSSSRHNRCTVSSARLHDEGDLKIFTIEADRFVYSMVRSLVGTLIDIGRGRISDTMADIIGSRDRKRAGSTAPACGLTLEQVFYKDVD